MTSMSSRFSIPLHVAILEIVRKKQQMKEDELMEALKAIYGDNIARSEVIKTLMRLELEGLIQVEEMKRGIRLIKIAKRL